MCSDSRYKHIRRIGLTPSVLFLCCFGSKTRALRRGQKMEKNALITKIVQRAKEMKFHFISDDPGVLLDQFETHKENLFERLRKEHRYTWNERFCNFDLTEEELLRYTAWIMTGDEFRENWKECSQDKAKLPYPVFIRFLWYAAERYWDYMYNLEYWQCREEI